jgi:hypothetical protein
VNPKPDDVREAEAIVKDLKAVMAHALAGNLEVVARVRDLVSSLVSDPPKIADAVRDPRVLVNRWLDFNIASLRIITEHSIDALNGIVSVAEASLDARSRAGANAFASRSNGQFAEPVELRIEGLRGTRATASFQLENFYNHPLEITFEAEPLFAPGRAPIAASALEIEPAPLQLPARGKQIVSVSVALDQAFSPGVAYEGRVRIVGFEARSLHVIVRALESHDDARRSTEPKRRRRGPSLGERT